jgi:hypothetical protein
VERQYFSVRKCSGSDSIPTPVMGKDESTDQSEHASSDERVDEAIAESFPASDPPSFTAGVSDAPPQSAPNLLEVPDKDHGDEVDIDREAS